MGNRVIAQGKKSPQNAKEYLLKAEEIFAMCFSFIQLVNKNCLLIFQSLKKTQLFTYLRLHSQAGLYCKCSPPAKEVK